MFKFEGVDSIELNYSNLIEWYIFTQISESSSRLEVV